MSHVRPKPYDVAVYGATAGGVMASIAAASEGMRVALLEPGSHIGGLALEFCTRVGTAYGVPAFSVTGPEPYMAERIFREWLDEAGVEVRFGRRLERIHKEGRRIVAVATTAGVYEAQVFIDASYEGDVAAGAGVTCAVGREGVGKYGESWAGRQPWRPHKHTFDVIVLPFKDETRDLLPLMHDRPLAALGEGTARCRSTVFASA